MVGTDNDHHVVGLMRGESVHGRAQVAFMASEINERDHFGSLRRRLQGRRLLVTLCGERAARAAQAHMLVLRDAARATRLRLVLVPQHTATGKPTPVVEEGRWAGENTHEGALARVHVADDSHTKVEVVALARPLANEPEGDALWLSTVLAGVRLHVHEGGVAFDQRRHLCEPFAVGVHGVFVRRANGHQRLAITVGSLTNAVLPRNIVDNGELGRIDSLRTVV